MEYPIRIYARNSLRYHWHRELHGNNKFADYRKKDGKMKNLTLENIAKAVEGKLFHGENIPADTEAEGVVIDSRQVGKNYIFVAIKGERVDGHDFVRDVFEKDALAMIAERELDTDRPYILVESSLEALKKLAAYYREGLDTKIVGITGSVGKTSTKEFISSVLGQKYKVLKTEGNFNNEIGVPLTLFKIRDFHEVAVIEMGISDFGEMHRLSYMVRPDICVMTNIGLCHLENLGSRDGILKAKSEIFDFASRDAVAVLNMDDDKLYSVKEVKNRKPVYYGMNRNADVYAESVEANGIYGTKAVIFLKKEDKKIEVKIPLPGKHMVYNAMAAATVGEILGLGAEEIRQGIENIQSVGGRLHIIETEKYTIIDDCYNANPVSVRSSLDVLNNAEERKVAILGDMFELGADEKKLHYQLGEYFKEKQIDMAVLAGELSENTYQGIRDSGAATQVYYYKTLEDLLEYLDIMVQEKDVILVKASHSMHFEKIVEKLRNEGNTN